MILNNYHPFYVNHRNLSFSISFVYCYYFLNCNRSILKILLSILLSSLISSNTLEQTMTTVTVATNFRFAMGELRQEFKKETGIDVTSVASSSGKMTSQIKPGVPFDVFLSANMKYPETLYKVGYAYGPLDT